MRAKWFVLVLALTLTACQGRSLFHFGQSPTPFPVDYSARIVVGEFELPIHCLGHGEPATLLEHGFAGRWDMDTLKNLAESAAPVNMNGPGFMLNWICRCPSPAQRWIK